MFSGRCQTTPPQKKNWPLFGSTTKHKTGFDFLGFLAKSKSCFDKKNGSEIEVHALWEISEFEDKICSDKNGHIK